MYCVRASCGAVSVILCSVYQTASELCWYSCGFYGVCVCRQCKGLKGILFNVPYFVVFLVFRTLCGTKLAPKMYPVTMDSI